MFFICILIDFCLKFRLERFSEWMALNVHFEFFVNLKNEEPFELENRNKFNSFLKSNLNHIYNSFFLNFKLKIILLIIGWKILNFWGDFKKSSSIKDKLFLKVNSFQFININGIINWIFLNYSHGVSTDQMALATLLNFLKFSKFEYMKSKHPLNLNFLNLYY